jgi:hypothetical protein
MKNIKLVVRSDGMSEGESKNLKVESNFRPMVGLSVSSFVQLISMDQQTCILEVYHSANKWGTFYFVEGSLYNAVCGNLEGEEAAMEMIAWDKVRININHNVTANDIVKKIEKGLLSLLMESSRRKDESAWDDRLKTSGQSVEHDEEDFSVKTMFDINDESCATGISEAKLNECIEICKKDMGDALHTASIISVADGKAMGGYNSNSEAVDLFNEITSCIQKVFKKNSYRAFGRYYIVDLKGDKILCSLVCGVYQYQFCIVFDRSKMQLGLFLDVIMPKITKVFEDAIYKMSHDRSSDGGVH